MEELWFLFYIIIIVLYMYIHYSIIHVQGHYVFCVDSDATVHMSTATVAIDQSMVRD